MGEKYLGIVRKHSHQKRGMRVVLTAIARFANDEGIAWPGNSTLVDETGLCERTIQRCIESLCDTPELRQLEQGNGRGNKRYLQITIPENGYERVTSTQKKGDKWASKDDNMSPFPKKKESEKTTICHPLDTEENIKRVTSSTKKGDILSPESMNQKQLPSNDGNAERSTRQAKLDLTTPEDDERATKTRRSELKAAYVEVLGHKNINHAQAGMGIKQLEHAGCTPEQLKGCYQWLKLDPFWEFKPISTQTIFKNLQEYLRYEQKANGSRGSPSLNGHSKLPTKVNFSVGEVLK
jgi:hypothetical protein